MAAVHAQCCEKYNSTYEPSHIQLSLDGVQEAKSSNSTTDAYSIKFDKCRNVYHLLLIKPHNREKYNEQKLLQTVFGDINSCDTIVIDDVICDNPKRAIVRNALCHSSRFACEYCESAGVSYVSDEVKKQVASNIQRLSVQKTDLVNKIVTLEQSPGTSVGKENDEREIVSLRELYQTLEKQEAEEKKKLRKNHIVWPSSTTNGRLRTITTIRNISTAIATGRNSDEESEELSHEDKLGIVGTSVLLYQPHFNMINNLPAEYMHSVCLGVVRRLLELTFRVGERRQSLSKMNLSLPSKFNSLIRNIRVPREFSRRCRHLDLSVMKAQEQRNLLLFFFPLVLQCIEDIYEDEKKVWLLLAYMIRACVLPNNEFQCIDKNDVALCSAMFYELYESTFGPKQCTYSIHVVSSHLLQIRGNQPLTFKSAFKFESLYSEMKNCYQPGTTSTLKQILRNLIMKRLVEYHVCQVSLFIKPDKTGIDDEPVKQSKECNDLVYVFKDKKYFMYKVINVNPDDTVTCVEQEFYDVFFQLTPNLSWANVGVFRIGPHGSDHSNLPISAIAGKVIRVDTFLITCPANVLQEK